MKSYTITKKSETLDWTTIPVAPIDIHLQEEAVDIAAAEVKIGKMVFRGCEKLEEIAINSCNYFITFMCFFILHSCISNSRSIPIITF